MNTSRGIVGLMGACISIYATCAHARSSVQVVADVADPSMPCEQVAQETRVRFTLPSTQPPTQYSLSVNGAAVGTEMLEPAWPLLTLRGGLHPGRNHLVLTATGRSGQNFHRDVDVQVGSASNRADTISVTCDRIRTASAHHHRHRARTAAIAAAPSLAPAPDAAPPAVAYAPAPTYAAPYYYPYTYAYPAYYSYPAYGYPYVVAAPYWGWGVGVRFGHHWRHW